MKIEGQKMVGRTDKEELLFSNLCGKRSVEEGQGRAGGERENHSGRTGNGHPHTRYQEDSLLVDHLGGGIPPPCPTNVEHAENPPHEGKIVGQPKSSKVPASRPIGGSTTATEDCPPALTRADVVAGGLVVYLWRRSSPGADGEYEEVEEEDEKEEEEEDDIAREQTEVSEKKESRANLKEVDNWRTEHRDKGCQLPGG
ncbi:PREDICTED: sodium/potassium/calcium exchanger 1-like [Ipomoea nil]|uniref:sodium/potassium/calcium exchanger 1-like n=1 Tax=Ipomoea nil TaxID=35883 RepID=UPI000900D6CD|nr:PREDICTED: sodium/potassium/calcium exchanger 1-like [Ipomoea nil]